MRGRDSSGVASVRGEWALEGLADAARRAAAPVSGVVELAGPPGGLGAAAGADARPHLKDVFARCVLPNVPGVVRGAVAAWPCATRWTDAHILERDPGAVLALRVGRLEDGAFGDVSQRADGPGYSVEEDVPLADALRRLNSGEAYAARVPLAERLPTLAEEVPPAKHLEYSALCGEGAMGGAVMYLGGGSQRTPLHFDPYENFVCVLDGEKRVRLWPPSASEALRPKAGGAFRYSAVDPTAPCAEHAEAFAAAPCVDVVARKGDVLYLPAFWWHDVRGGEGRNLTVNYWFRMHPMKREFVSSEVAAERGGGGVRASS